MLEAVSHKCLKEVLNQISESSLWPHNLTLGRIVARSLRRGDNTLIKLDTFIKDDWWLGVLVPLSLVNSDVVLIISERQKTKIFDVYLPILNSQGIFIDFWQDLTPPSQHKIWLLGYKEFLYFERRDDFADRFFLLPEFDTLSENIINSVSLLIRTNDWEDIRRTNSQSSKLISQFYQRFTKKVFSKSARKNDSVRLDTSELRSFQILLKGLNKFPKEWNFLLESDPSAWASWAEIKHQDLSWEWHLKPLRPLDYFRRNLKENKSILIAKTFGNDLLDPLLDREILFSRVSISLKSTKSSFPLPLFAPSRQPFPNDLAFTDYLIGSCRRLIISRKGITIILLDDYQILVKLLSRLSADFGKSVSYEEFDSERSSVICCSSSWWIGNKDLLPIPDQIIICLLPIPSLEDPFVAAQVEYLKLRGGDWFRELLLPDALRLMVHSVEPLRRNGGRLAILDGRLRGRPWGKYCFQALQPFTFLQRLLPD